MSKFPTHFDTPEDAYFGFFKADSAQNAPGWAAVMSYPHGRVAARGPIYYCDTEEEYAANADWTKRRATGWVRSVGHPPRRVHESSDKVHLLGGWTRYNKDDEPILSNDVLYILTRPGTSWGIQARFSSDTDSGEDAGNAAPAGVDLARQFFEARAASDLSACAALCRYPFLRVGVGALDRVEDAAGLLGALDAPPPGALSHLDAQAVQSGSHGVLADVTARYESGETEHAIVVVGMRDDAWEIGGVSILRA